jgi:amino acid transporter
MGRLGAIPKLFSNIHPRFLSPGFSTLWMGTVSMLVYVGLSITSHNNLIADAFTSLALTIAFYYGITGFACAVFYRKHLFKSAKNFVMLFVLPVAGGLMLFGVMVKAIIEYAHKDGGYAKPLLGIGSPVAIALITIVVGLIFMFTQRLLMPEFFTNTKREVVDPETLAGAPAGRAEL